MGAYKTKDRKGQIHELIIPDQFDEMVNKEFVLVFPIMEGDDPELLPYNAFTRFLKAKGIKY